MAELVDALGLGSSEFIRGGSSPLIDTCGVSSAVERYPSKLDVVGSIPILRSYP